MGSDPRKLSSTTTTEHGEVIVLNGASSAGKSTLAVALQAELIAAGECWFVWAVDDFLAKLPEAWLGYFEVGDHADEGVRFDRVGDAIELRTGPIGDGLFAVYRETIGRLARAGLNVIVDEVILTESGWLDWQRQLDGLSVQWVRVECPLAVIEQREGDRGNRLIGMARSQLRTVHRFPAYDVAIDTAELTPAAAARRILEARQPGR